MNGIDGRLPPEARDITTGQANRVWSVDGPTPYILKHYDDPARAANEAAALRLLATHRAPAPQLLAASQGNTPPWTAQNAIYAKLCPQISSWRSLPNPWLPSTASLAPTSAASLAPDDTATGPTTPTTNCTCTRRPPRPCSPRPDCSTRKSMSGGAVQPVLLHHDLQPGHLLRKPDGSRLLIDWELAIFGDEKSDLGRLAVRLGLDDPTPVLALANRPGPTAEGRIQLYWHIHLLADAALSTDPVIRERAAARLSRRR
ncbi:phosphotransferase family protein [Streptomyces halobius]|uniref:Phosphotransferase n=1 Tax=Streptomyces halobius TaxID=2879846 RepID=A0ABY4M464_9ACTN|nr:phosphotransferase [Streptomyces halobius]UQA92483.1 phosphotransferase [Streptomyces halobius]